MGFLLEGAEGAGAGAKEGGKVAGRCIGAGSEVCASVEGRSADVTAAEREAAAWNGAEGGEQRKSTRSMSSCSRGLGAKERTGSIL